MAIHAVIVMSSKALIGNAHPEIVVTTVHFLILLASQLHSVQNVKIRHSVPVMSLTFPAFMVHAVEVRFKEEGLV